MTDLEQPSLGTWAATQRQCLHHRLGNLEQVTTSADEWIARLDEPPAWLIETAMSRSPADALTALSVCCESFDRDQVSAALMAAWRDLLDADPSAEERIAKALFFMAAYENDVPSPEAAREMLNFWDALDLARRGLYGDLDTIRAALRAFLIRWSDPKFYTGHGKGG